MPTAFDTSIFKSYDVRGIVRAQLNAEPLLRLNVEGDPEGDPKELIERRDEALALIRG